MSTGNINIGESELEIMKVIWRAGMPINSTTISEAVKENRQVALLHADFNSKRV